ncbi:MAG: DUF3108 domain-containing protein [Candidatus Niyogibacteria bacterium]|nr:DUF3108 domain-containing protein [Candidatus Niyogibacteria bacterium]
MAISLADTPNTYAADAGKSLPFQVGERLVYEISWSGFIGGEAIIQINGQVQREDARVLLINTTARSTGLLRLLYPIEDVSLSYFDIDNLRSCGADVHITENNYKKHAEITFDHKKNIATYKTNEETPQEYPITKNTNDAFSALYAFRAMRDRIKIGESMSLPVFDDRKQHELIIKVLRQEKVSLARGSVNTIVATFFLESGGLFQQKGEMTVWFSDDAAFAPIKIKANASIGTFYITLKEWSGVTLQVVPFKTR